MEPTIYKPGIYKGAGIYKVGAEGGNEGGGIIGNVIIGGKNYKTITIGNVTWLRENLNWIFPGCTFNPNTWSGGGLKCCYYGGGDSEIKRYYGLLYTWDCANYLEQNKAELIPGWHIPNETDYNNIKAEMQNIVSWAANIEGTLLKSRTDWNGNGNGVDYFGFCGFPAGMKNHSNGLFENLGDSCTYWTTKSYSSTRCYGLYLRKDEATFSFDTLDKKHGMSIRLVKD